jgi:ABC-type nitrate/sulfonate/bicarbonate transport system substrate-binding protein
MAHDLELTIMLADYHRTRPLLNGEVAAEGIRLQPRRAETGEACLRPVYEEFDIAEMSLSWYMMARCRDEPVIALPIFPLRMQIHPYIFCSAKSGIERAEDLKGKKIGMDEYRLTVGLWSRGILQEYHGVRPEECEWFTASPEAPAAGYKIPSDVSVTVVNEPTEQLLLRGEIDALIPPNIVPSFRAKDPRIRRVFKDIRAAVNDYFLETKIFPITHTLVVRQSLFEKNPWLVSSLLDAFTKAEEICRKSYDYAKRSAFPSAVLILEEEEELFGRNPWGHGLTPENQVVLEKFVQYAKEQGYIPRRPLIGDLFAPVGN